jgi:hypothetical protein
VQFNTLVLPTVGTINSRAIRGRQPRRDQDKERYLSVPKAFMSMLVGLIDGDGYISVTESSTGKKSAAGGYIDTSIVISIHLRDLKLLQYVQSTLGIGRVNTYNKLNCCKLIINRTDLQEIFLPLMQLHAIQFITRVRVEQYNVLMLVLTQNIKRYKDLPCLQEQHASTYLASYPKSPSAYLTLGFSPD